MKSINKVILYLGLVLIAQNIFAQDNTKKKEEKSSFNESVIITTQFDPIVNEASKLYENPSIFDTTFSSPSFSYEIINKAFPTKLEVAPIKAAKVKGEPLAMLYNTNIKAGFGNYLTSYLEAFYSETRNRTLLYSAHFRHYSSLWSVKDYAHSHFSNNDLNLYGKKIWDNFFVDAKAFFNNSTNYYYGFVDSLDFTKSNYKAPWNNFGLNLNYGSLYRNDDAIHNSASFGISYLTGKWGNNELNLNLGLDVNKRFELFYNDKQTIGLKIDYVHKFDNNKFNNTPYFNDTLHLNSNTYNTGIVSIKPYFDFKVQKFELRTALNISPEFGKESKLYLFPNAIVSFPILPKQLFFKGGITSGVERVSLNNLRLENPYISPFLNLKSTSNYRAYGSLNSTFMPNLDISIEGGLQRFIKHHFYMIDTNALLENMYDIEYDNLTKIYLKARIGYFIDKQFSFIANLEYQKLSTGRLEYAYYMPAFTASISLQYIAAEKLIFNLTPNFKTGVKALYMGKNYTLDPIIDINLSAEYKHNDQLSFFVRLNNIAFQRYYEYYNYPSQKFLGMAGVSFSF